jgi:hypothetical protein
VDESGRRIHVLGTVPGSPGDVERFSSGLKRCARLSKKM